MSQSSAVFCADKRINQYVKTLVDAGWTVTSGRHCKLHHPSGRGFVTFSRTPSDHRCLMNIRRDVRKLENRLAET